MERRLAIRAQNLWRRKLKIGGVGLRVKCVYFQVEVVLLLITELTAADSLVAFIAGPVVIINLEAWQTSSA